MQQLNETTEGFRGEYFFLSNFYASPITVEFEGESFTFATGEHVFQGMKVRAALRPDENEFMLRQLEHAQTPAKAKYWGRSLRIDIKRWDAMAQKCMRRTLQLKFEQHPDLAQKLVATGQLQLVEYNDWHDQLWGKDSVTREEQNLLGKMLMQLREDLQRSSPSLATSA